VMCFDNIEAARADGTRRAQYGNAFHSRPSR
jgi:hypothetical protein